MSTQTLTAAPAATVNVAALPLSHELMAYGPEPITGMVDGNLVVTYAAPDYGNDYEADWALNDSELDVFTSEEDRDEHVRGLRRDGVVPSRIFIVNHCRHGASDYSVAFSMTHPIPHYRPADRWDTVPSTVLVIPDDVPVRRRRDYADGVCRSYTQWANGWMSQIITDTFSSSPDGEDWELIDTEAVGGFLGDPEPGDLLDYSPVPATA